MPLGQKQLRPADVVEHPETGQCTRPIKRWTPDGQEYFEMFPVCERCWERIPAYVDAPSGFVSPDSARKLKVGMVDGHAAVIANAKIVCYDCLREDHLEMFGAFAEIPHEVKA